SQVGTGSAGKKNNRAVPLGNCQWDSEVAHVLVNLRLARFPAFLREFSKFRDNDGQKLDYDRCGNVWPYTKHRHGEVAQTASREDVKEAKQLVGRQEGAEVSNTDSWN